MITPVKLTSASLYAGPTIARPAVSMAVMVFSQPNRAAAIPRRIRLSELRVQLKTSSRIAELSQHEADGGELQEGEAAAVEIFPVLGETAAAIEPSNRAFYDPTLG